MTMDLFSRARDCLAETEPERKCTETRALYAALQNGQTKVCVASHGDSMDQPGRPSRPELVPPRALARRRLSTLEGRAALLHALAHIEFNAINLALDAVCRFGDMPDAYYRDWLQVADEEAYHFTLLRARLRDLDYDYGDFPAHNGLWEMALKTRDDVLVRMALVPRVLEARGLDVTPGIVDRLREVGDGASVAILDIILRDEIGHVAIGTRWFHYACAQRGVDPDVTFQHLIAEYMRGRIKGPFHRTARVEAGFSMAELENLESLDRKD